MENPWLQRRALDLFRSWTKRPELLATDLEERPYLTLQERRDYT
jgi:hypothetical protein